MLEVLPGPPVPEVLAGSFTYVPSLQSSRVMKHPLLRVGPGCPSNQEVRRSEGAEPIQVMAGDWSQWPGVQEGLYIAADCRKFFKCEQFLPHKSFQVVFAGFDCSLPETAKVGGPLGAVVPGDLIIEGVCLYSILAVCGGKHLVEVD